MKQQNNTYMLMFVWGKFNSISSPWRGSWFMKIAADLGFFKLISLKIFWYPNMVSWHDEVDIAKLLSKYNDRNKANKFKVILNNFKFIIIEQLWFRRSGVNWSQLKPSLIMDPKHNECPTKWLGSRFQRYDRINWAWLEDRSKNQSKEDIVKDKISRIMCKLTELIVE